MQIGLTAVQSKFQIEDYKDKNTFYKKVDDLMQKVSQHIKQDNYNLVCFPETLGLPLLFIMNEYEHIKNCNTIKEVSIKLIKRHWKTLSKAVLKHRILNLSSFYLLKAIEVYKVYYETFSTIARTYKIYLSAGSVLLPEIDIEPVKGIFIKNKKVFNISYTFNPYGQCIGIIPKVNLTPGIESSIGLSKGKKSDLMAIHTPFGKIGILICYDGFHETLVEHYDAQGVQILVKPSANHGKWDAPWWSDYSINQSRQWLRDGLRHMVQNRENIKYGINPMMVGKIFDLETEGRSTIVADTQLCKNNIVAEGFNGIINIAQTATEEEIVYAEIVK